MKSSYPEMPANMNVLVVNKSDKVMRDVKAGNGVEIENVVVSGSHHDHRMRPQ